MRRDGRTFHTLAAYNDGVIYEEKFFRRFPPSRVSQTVLILFGRY